MEGVALQWTQAESARRLCFGQDDKQVRFFRMCEGDRFSERILHQNAPDDNDDNVMMGDTAGDGDDDG